MAHDASLFSGRPSELIGQQIAGYRIEDEIGRGGMAVVYRAHDLRLDRTVALKLLAPELARNDTFRKRFTHESRVAAAIDHPHIVPVFEAGETDGVLYIAMRYVSGSDLRHLLDREGPLDLPTTTRIIGQVASALDAAHEHGLVHRDVKPGNILVARGTDSDHPEHVYLTDFGLTKKSLSLTGSRRSGSSSGRWTMWLPSRSRGGRSTGGAMCTGWLVSPTRPWRGFRRFGVMTTWRCCGRTSTTCLRRSVRGGGLPGHVDGVFAKALAKSPDDRYASCLAFVSALRGGEVGHAATEVDLRVGGGRMRGLLRFLGGRSLCSGCVREFFGCGPGGGWSRSSPRP